MNVQTLKIGAKAGLNTFGLVLFLDLLGLPLTLGRTAVTVFVALVALMAFYYLRDQARRSLSLAELAVNGALIGLIAGIGLAVVTAVIANLQANGTEITEIFAQLRPEHIEAMTTLADADGVVREDVSQTAVLARLVLFMTLGGLAGGLLSRLTSNEAKERIQPFLASDTAYYTILVVPFVFYLGFAILTLDGVTLGGDQKNIIGLVSLFFFIGLGLVAIRRAKTQSQTAVLAVILLAVLLVIPYQADQFQMSVLGRVALFTILGLGLNIIIGYSGLLVLGYGAFFAVGSYGYALLSAPNSYFLAEGLFSGVGFWIGLPLAIGFGALAGILLGIPVLRLRGDYLAIVTLGFGEIIRLLILNLRDYTNGPGGLLNIPAPELFGYDLGNTTGIFYLSLFFAGLAAFISYRLRDSKIGRAWVAIREDETVAQAMGINLVGIKLLAFSIGAALAGLAGVIYAAQQVNIFPDNFNLLVSIDVLSLVIIGGMGSLEGMILGSIMLIGMPEILRGVDEYRIVAFGALLVAMMIWRPEGILPSARRQVELRADDRAQDAWLDKARKAAEAEKAKQEAG